VRCIHCEWGRFKVAWRCLKRLSDPDIGAVLVYKNPQPHPDGVTEILFYTVQEANRYMAALTEKNEMAGGHDSR